MSDGETEASHWRTRLRLEPHPEGGWFRRIYTSSAEVATAHGPRPLASSIHYLLDRDQPSGLFHRVRPTILHFLQAGGPVEYALLAPDGTLRTVTLGLDAGAEIVLEVAAGTWKASRLAGAATFAMVSEVVLPGFDWADHEILTPQTLDQWPVDAVASLRQQGWRLG